jgi:hypothetical protein
MNIKDLPTLRIPPVMTDADVTFDSEIKYFWDLLVDIHELAYTKRYANPFPISLSDDLRLLTAAVQAIR